MPNIQELRQMGDAAIKTADKIFPGVGERATHYAHKAISAYEKLPGVAKVAIEFAAITLVVGGLSRKAAKRAALRDLDMNEVTTEVDSVVADYTAATEKNPEFDKGYAEFLRNVNEAKQGEIFDSVLTQLHDEKFRKKITDQQLAAIATAGIKTHASEAVHRVSSLLAVIPHAEGYMSDADSIVSTSAQGISEIGNDFLASVAQQHGTPTHRAARMLSKSLDAFAKGRELGKQDAIDETTKVTEQKLIAALGHGAVGAPSEVEIAESNKAMLVLMERLEKARIVKKSEGSRRDRHYDAAQMQEVADAVKVFALENNLVSEQTRKSAGVAQILIILGGNLAKRYASAQGRPDAQAAA